MTTHLATRWVALRATLAEPIVTRCAPSPTGELHLGHVLHLYYLREIAELTGARIVMRIEDHDRSRCTPELEARILDDIAWLGFAPDDISWASLRAAPPSPYRQSDDPERYQRAFAQLAAAGVLYGCTCTRGNLGPPDEHGERRYPGTCRGQPITRDGRHVVRVMLPDEPTVVEDLLLGSLRQHPLRDHGDPVVRDALGQWSYQFSVVVDDMVDGVNLIVRGEDIAASTGRQLLLARLLGRTLPFVTAHHPLLLDDDGKKLSKREGSLGIRTMREEGLSPLEVLERALARRQW